MAEAVFRDMVEAEGLDDAIAIDSAGTGPWHVGERPHRGTRSVLERHGIVHGGRARQITRRDFDAYDYILAMDYSNLDDLERMAPKDFSGVLRSFLSFAPDAPTDEVPDPYYSGRFEEVYQLVRQGAQGLLSHIRREHHL